MKCQVQGTALTIYHARYDIHEGTLLLASVRERRLSAERCIQSLNQVGCGSRRELAEELAPDDGDDIDDEQAIGRLFD